MRCLEAKNMSEHEGDTFHLQKNPESHQTKSIRGFPEMPLPARLKPIFFAFLQQTTGRS